MKTPFLVACAIVCAISAAQANVSFSDTFSDRLVRFTEEGETFYSIVSAGKFTARGKVALTPEESSTPLDRNTPVTLAIGLWFYSGVLGDDPSYDPAKSKSVNIPLEGGSLKLAISRNVLTWSVTAKTGATFFGQSFEVSPVAEALYAEESSAISPADDIRALCRIAVGGESASANIPVTGTVKFLLKTVGSGDAAEEFGLCTVKIKGAATLVRD